MTKRLIINFYSPRRYNNHKAWMSQFLVQMKCDIDQPARVHILDNIVGIEFWHPLGFEPGTSGFTVHSSTNIVNLVIEK